MTLMTLKTLELTFLTNKMDTLRDEKLSALMKAMPEEDTAALGAEIMHRIGRKAARRRAWRTVSHTALGIVAGAVVLLLLVGAFALLARIGGLGDWLKAVDEYTVSGLLHLRMFCSSATVITLFVAVATIVGVRVLISVLERRHRQNM